MSRRIALVFDCDGTIAEDSTTRLLRHLGIDEKRFWSHVSGMEERGWEPALAYMKLLGDYSVGKGTLPNPRPITKKIFETVAKKLKLSPGIPTFFREMKNYINQKYSSHGISLGIYVISGGVEEIIRASRVNFTSGGTSWVDDIFGCRFEYDSSGAVTFPKCAITYTEKTKYIFAINKGISSEELARDAYCVNDYVPDPGREIPLVNMIYIGDGPTDVACMSLLKKAGCEVFAVYTPPRYGIPKKTYELAKQGRFTRGPFNRDYRAKSDLVRTLQSELDGYAEQIMGEARAKRRPAVRHA